MRPRLEALNKPGTWLAMAGVVMLLGIATAGWRWFASRQIGLAPVAVAKTAPVAEAPRPVPPKSAPMASTPRPPPVATNPALDKAERVKKILRDYEDIQSKMAADYSAAGQAFPGGLNAFLRQLALLEREKRKDLAKVMTPGELEDYEIRETAAGQRTRSLLDGTAATDEQRRAAFRAEQQFDDQYGFTFDLTPAVLATREEARQATEEKVHGLLGDALFAAWLRDDASYARVAAFAQQQNLDGSAAISLWQVRNKVTLGTLQLTGDPSETSAQKRAALLEWGRSQVAAIASTVPAGAIEREVNAWLAQPSTNRP